MDKKLDLFVSCVHLNVCMNAFTNVSCNLHVTREMESLLIIYCQTGNFEFRYVLYFFQHLYISIHHLFLLSIISAKSLNQLKTFKCFEHTISIRVLPLTSFQYLSLVMGSFSRNQTFITSNSQATWISVKQRNCILLWISQQMMSSENFESFCGSFGCYLLQYIHPIVNTIYLDRDCELYCIT